MVPRSWPTSVTSPEDWTDPFGLPRITEVVPRIVVWAKVYAACQLPEAVKAAVLVHISPGLTLSGSTPSGVANAIWADPESATLR
jgi:hypothetical protein